MSVRILDDRVMVLPDPVTEVETESGLILPKETQERATRGEVILAGSKVDDVEVGDRVWFSPYGGLGTNWDGQEVLIMRESDLLAVEQ